MVNASNLDFLFSLNGKDITKSAIFKLFGKHLNSITNEVEEPMFYTWEEIDVKAGQIGNLHEDVHTTVGRYLLNMAIIDYCFSSKIDYINETMNGKNYGKLVQLLCDKMIGGEITGEEMASFQQRICWFNNFTEIIMPGLSDDLLVLPKEIKDEYQRLLAENADIVKRNDTVAYMEKIEKPILKFARKYYMDKHLPSWDIYSLGSKPKFDNVFKNMFIECGPMLDIATGKYRISTHCFADGIDPREYDLYANQSVNGSYSRAVNTAYGGAKTKEFMAAFQSLVVTEDDCRSKDTIAITITDDNIDDVKWRWIASDDKADPSYDGNGFVLLTPDKAKTMIGQTVHCRSPLFCHSDNLCWKCVGEIYKKTGLKNIGLTLSKLTSIFLNTSLKMMHDQTIKTFEFNPLDCFYDIKTGTTQIKPDFLRGLSDKSWVLDAPHAQIVLPEKYFDKNICEFVGKNVNTFGIFEMRVFRTEDFETEKPERYFFKFKSMFITCPSSISEERDENGEKNIILEFNEGSTVIASSILQSDVNVARRMLDFMTLGYLPNIINYEDIADYWSSVNSCNKINLSAMSQTSIELIVSELCRDPDDFSRAFRKRLFDKPKTSHKAWVMLNTRMIPRYTSVWASLTSGDPKGNLTSMISKQRDGKIQKQTPLEDAIL